MQTAPPAYRPYEASSKYNQIMNRECPTDRECRLGTERRDDWMNRDWNRDWFNRDFNNWNREMMPWMNNREWFNRDFNNFNRDMWNFDRDFEHRMMPWMNRDWFNNRDFWLNNWNNREMMPWMNNRDWFNRDFNNWNREMMPWMNNRNWFNREWNREMMPWNWNNEWNNLWNVNFRPTNRLEYECLTHPIRVLNKEGDREIFLTYDLKGFKPEEINCTFDRKERCIIVEAKHEIKEGKEHHVMRTFYRKFMLPSVLAKTDLTKCELRTCFTDNGMLRLEINLPRLTSEEIAACPTMYKQLTMPWNNEELGCWNQCLTSKVNTKVM